MVARDIPKVVHRIDAVHKNQRAKESSVGHVYSKTEFEAITNEWVEVVKVDYQEMKMNHNSIKVLNDFVAVRDSYGRQIESKKAEEFSEGMC